MTDFDGRLTAVERKAFEHGVTLDELDRDLHELLPLVRSVDRLQGSYDGLRGELAAARESIGGIRKSLDDRDQRATDERRAVKVALIALTGVILSALVAAAVTLVAAGAL